ncbi:hypothetical protein ACWDAO_13855, partial [Streptomyces sp. NPDC001212]
LTHRDAADVLDTQRAEHLRSMRILTDRKRKGMGLRRPSLGPRPTAPHPGGAPPLHPSAGAAPRALDPPARPTQ